MADVVVVGCGAAGGAAAIAAHDHGADVLVLEKMAELGGTTRVSGGRSRFVLNPEQAIAYYHTLCEGATPRDVIAAFVHEGEELPAWLESLGGRVEVVPEAAGTYPGQVDPKVAGAEAIGRAGFRVAGGTGAGGANLIALLTRAISARGIRVWPESPAEHLITGAEGAIQGVAARQGDRILRIEARRAVILTCGGITSNREMLRDYTGHDYVTHANPGNTGDGVRMALAVGADLWHMSAVSVGLGYRVPDIAAPIAHRMCGPGFVYLDQTARRFMNETGVDTHHIWSRVNEWDPNTMAYPRAPAYVVFDEDTCRAGPVGVTEKGIAGDVYQWSHDNEPEIARGWITRAGSLAELATALGLRLDRLQEAVARYNLYCVGGYDPDFDRTADTLAPIVRPPYYGARIWPVLGTAQGGARRNARAQVLSVSGQPIARLYSAGEFGSMWHRLYPGFANVKEALAFGRIAGRNAAAERPLA